LKSKGTIPISIASAVDHFVSRLLEIQKSFTFAARGHDKQSRVE